MISQPLMEQLCSIKTLQLAADWLQSESSQYQPNLAELAKKLRSGEYCFQPVTTMKTTNKLGESKTLEVWELQDRLVLKAMSLVLTAHFLENFPTGCHHLEGRCGIKKVVRQTRELVQNHPDSWVLKIDMKGYYTQIDHFILYNQLQTLMPDEDYLLRLCWQYLKRSVYEAGYYYDQECGISLGCPLSPLMATWYLQLLDQAFEGGHWFYARFMDDWVIIAPTRWQLRSAAEKVYQILNQHQLTIADGKTFFGLTRYGFDFLGYHFTPKSLKVDKKALQHRDVGFYWLFAQGTDEIRVGESVSRWQQWVKTSLQGQLREEFQSFPRQIDTNQLSLETKFFALGVASVMSTAAIDSPATVYQLGTGFPIDGQWDIPCLNLSFGLEAKVPHMNNNVEYIGYMWYDIKMSFDGNIPLFRVYTDKKGKVKEKYLITGHFHIEETGSQTMKHDILSRFNQLYADFVRGIKAKNLKIGELSLPVFGWVRVNYRLNWYYDLSDHDNYGIVSYGIAIGELPSLDHIDNVSIHDFCSELTDPTMAINATFTILEDSVFSLPDDFFDLQESNRVESIKFTQLETASDLKIHGSKVNLTQTYSLNDFKGLKFYPATNANGSNYANFKFKVNDDTNEYAFTFNVTPVNDAPSFIKGADQIVEAGTDREQTVMGWATNISKGPIDESTQSLKFEIDYSRMDYRLFDRYPRLDANGNLTYTISNSYYLRYYEVATFNVTLQDNGGTANGGVDKSNAQTFTITMKPPITLSISEFICKSASTAIGTVSVPIIVFSDLTINLTNDYSDVVTVPDTITIPMGQNYATFMITDIDNSVIDARQMPTITASHANYTSASVKVNVHEKSLENSVCFASILETDGQIQPNHAKLMKYEVKRLKLSTMIAPLPTQIGNQAKLLIVALYQSPNGSTVTYHRHGSDWLPWDGEISSLTAAEEIAALPNFLEILIFQGDLSTMPGNFIVYVGFQLQDGTIHYNDADPIQFEIE